MSDDDDLTQVQSEPTRTVLLRCAGPIAFMILVAYAQLFPEHDLDNYAAIWLIVWSTVGLAATFSARATLGSKVASYLLNSLFLFGGLVDILTGAIGT